MNIPRIVVAGTHSGAGKTSVTLGLLRALRNRGLVVQPYKVGPDFIDPTLHTAAAGRISRNLDSWLLPHPTVAELFARGAEGADVAVIEGVMGLYDGYHGAGNEGSTAEVAGLLGAPVVLVVDVSGAVRSAAATAMGFSVFDPELSLAGVIATRTGGARHAGWLRDALETVGIPLLGTIPWDARLRLPERHLGLIPATEYSPEAVIAALADAVEAHVDLDALLRAAKLAPPLVVPGPLVFPLMPAPARVRIGVARDAAFSFYYQDALDLLEARGAQLIAFSPLADPKLPDVDGLYLGGGFPEIHAGALAANHTMRQDLREAAAGAMPIYAECGGMLCLCETLIDTEGKMHEMVGVLPAVARMQPRLEALGYVTLRAGADTLLLREGETARGHEYHYSTVTPTAPVELALASSEGRGIAGGKDGFAAPGLLASYAHVHFAGNPVMAERFVDACKDFKSRRRH